MFLTMPCAPDQNPVPSVLSSIINQSLKPDWSIIYRKGKPITDTPAGYIHKVHNIVASRNYVLDLWLQLNYEYFCMNDQDCQHLMTDNLKNAVDFLESNIDIIAVAFAKEGTTQRAVDQEHVGLGVWVFKRRFLETGVRFRVQGNCCECVPFCADLRQYGQVRFLDSQYRIRDGVKTPTL